jgi:hypothetical protein
MMADPTPEERTNLRMMCVSLRKLLALEKPASVMAFLQDIGNIESDAVVTIGNDFHETKGSFDELLQVLRALGIINPRNWTEFFGEQK